MNFSNRINLKEVSRNNLGLGLPNLIQRYKLMCDAEVEIHQDDGRFIIKLPIIKP